VSSKWTHKACFNYYGCEPKNIQWSWSARDEQTNTVCHTLWAHKYKRESGDWIYRHVHISRSPGYREFVENMRYAIGNCEGVFKVIWARAVDPAAQPLSIKEPWPAVNLPNGMKIIEFNEKSGLLVACPV
jgi:hypothetical protein